MPNEVTPTQADLTCAVEFADVLARKAPYASLVAATTKAFAAHRIAHEAPLLARIAELEGALAGVTREAVWMVEAVDVDGLVHRKQGTTVLIH